MNTITPSTSRLVDIVAPHSLATTFSYSLTLIIITVLTTVILIVIFWKSYHSKTQSGIRQLKRIQHDLITQKLTPRMACYKIAALYKQWFSLNHLPENCDFPAPLSGEQSIWNNHLQRLHSLRYSTQQCTEQDVNELITETRYWLKHWQ